MKRFSLFLTAFFLFTSLTYSQKFAYPQPKKIDQNDSYFGTTVADPYRWMEDLDSKEVAEWVEAENKVTFSYLEKIPFRTKLKERLTKIWNYPKYGLPYKEGEQWFFSKNNGLQNQSVLYVQKSLDAQPEVLLDPNTFSSDGTIALSGSSFTNDGKYLAYSITRSGSDWREIFVMDVNAKKKLSDSVNWAKFSGITWHSDGFYYSAYDPPKVEGTTYSAKNEYHKVYYHTLGTSQTEDKLIHEDKENAYRNFGIGITEDERFLILSASQKGSNGNAFSVRDLQKGETEWNPIVTSFDDDFSVIDNVDAQLLCITNKNAPNQRVVLIDPNHPEEKNWKEIIPEKKEVLSYVQTAGGKLIAVYMQDASNRVYQYDYNGKLENEITLPTLCTVGGFGGKKEDTFVFYSVTSFVYPSTIFKYDLKTKESTLFRSPEIDFSFTEYETKQVFYKSNDGTKIPMFITMKKGTKMNGNNPTFLYGYGGFNISLTPSFSIARLVWLENGGIYAQANMRGGGEYGEDWHQAGTKLKKQNVFDDFISAAEYLIEEKYTSSSKLAIQGGSNGGLLVGATINQRPELFKVALPAVGVMDMLRFHKFTIGWAWVSDYGSSDDSAQFQALYKYSPLHNIGNKNYPATLVTTADHDDRVVPSHSFKYISTLQEKYSGDNPVMIRVQTKAGHGAGKPTSIQIEEAADIFAFTFYNLNIVPVK
ncbi:MAG: S9 family peptidase [Ignavibacteriales bacterium]|nr:S9 family peptidase [Ignavibacteriales bacterium]